MKTLHTIYSTFAKHNMAKFLTVLTMLLMLGIGQAWGADTWTLVTDASTLKAGDELVIVCASEGKVAGNISSSIMASVGVTISDNTITNLPSDAVTLTLGGSSGAWTFAKDDGKLLGATAVKKVAWGSGTTTWSISIDNSDNATIQNGTSTYGRFLYNSGSPRFTTYTSSTSASMLLPQLYRKEASCTSITPSLSYAQSSLSVGGTANPTLTGNTGNGTVTYTSSSTSVAIVNASTGVVTAKAAGTTTITATIAANNGYCEGTATASITVTAAPCDNKVTIEKGTESNGTFTLDKSGEQETCDGLTITVTPNADDHYSVSSVTATTPTTGEDPNVTDNGNGTWSVVYAENSTGNSIINVTFAEDPKATITLSEAGATTSITGNYVGDQYTLPSSDATCDDKEFVGWSTEQISTATDNPTATIYEAGASVTLAKNNTFYAVFATKGESEGTTSENVTRTYTFSEYIAGTQYASNEEHILDDDVTIWTTNCHFTTQLRIYSTSDHNGYVISNELPGRIVSIGFNAGNKVDAIDVYGSTNGTAWTKVGQVSVTSTSYKNYTLSFGENNYTYFKLDVAGSNQVRLQSLTIIWEKSAASTTPTYTQYTTSCSGKIGTTLKWSADEYLTTLIGEHAFPTLTTSPDNLTGVTYSSSNTDVAEINANTGTITIKGIGETTITASFAGNDTYDAATDATYTLTVADIYTVSYAVGNGDTAPASNTVVQGNKVTLPNLPTTLNCVSFIGWTDDQNGYTHGTSKLYKAGVEYKPTATITLHAVYGVGAGYVLVENVETLTAGTQVIIANTEAYVAMGADRGNNRAEVSVTISDNTLTPAEGVEIFTLEEGTSAGTFAFKTSVGYIYAASSNSNYLRTQTTNNANGSWKITITDGVTSIVAKGENSHNIMQYNSGSKIFSCYSSSQKPVSLYAQNITNYTTDPECETYSVSACDNLTNGTITIEKMTVDPYGSTNVTFAPATGYMLDAVTVSPSDKATVQAFTADVTGNRTLKISNIQSDIEVCATFVEIPYYKVTFVDVNNGNSQVEVFQESFGGNVTTPTTASDPCGAEWAFVGWAKSNAVTGAANKPDGFVAKGDVISGEDLSSDQVYYSIYSKNTEATAEFSDGESGKYYFKAIVGETDYYATGTLSSNKYPSNQVTKIPFDLTYNQGTDKYTIKNTLTNLYLAPTDDNYLVEQSTSYEWDLKCHAKGEFTWKSDYEYNYTSANALSGEYLFTYAKDETTTRCIDFDGTRFSNSGFGTNYDDYALSFEAAGTTTYSNKTECEENITMHFNPIGTMTYASGYEEDYYTNTVVKNVYVFPTDEYAGWKFIGWTAGTPYNDFIGGKESLDGENAAATTPTQDIYNTSDTKFYPLVTSVEMYPVFTKYDDNEDVDLVNGGEFYMYFYREGDYYKDDYFGSDNHYQRMYASAGGGDNGEFGYTTNCNNAQIFEFIKEGDGWNIRVKNADGTYPTKSYLVNTSGNDYDLVAAKPSSTWSITKEAEGDFTMWYRGNASNSESNIYYQAKAREYSGGTSWDFKCYNQDNDASQYYYKVYLGTCENRVFSSNPSNQLTVTWNPNGGQWADGSTFKITQSYEEGDTFSAPETPTREGYTFAGWSDGENTYDANDTFTMPAEKVTYTAIWEINQYTVTWKLAGGSVNGSTDDIVDTYDFGASITVPTNPTRTGYTFGGWLPTVAETMPAHDATYVAQWIELTNFRTLCEYTVTWELAGGQIDGSTDDIVNAYTRGQEIVPPTHPTLDGWKFMGWDPEFVAGTTMQGEDLTYVAQWAKAYTVTYDANGGSTTCEDNNEYAANDIVTVCNNQPTKAGYTFAGWMRNDNSTIVQPDATFAMPATDVTLIAQWTANTNTPYVVEHYQQNLDGTYPTTPTEKEELAGTTDTQVIPAVKSYDGFTAPATQTVIIAAAGNLVVKYQYTRNSYTLAWDLDGGTVTTEGTAAGSIKFGAPITAPVVEKVGHNFEGWEPTVPTNMPANDATYKAIWEVASHTVTWDPNGGHWDGDHNKKVETYNYGDQIIKPTNPEKTGYVFLRWQPEVDETMQNSDLTYTAEWGEEFCDAYSFHWGSGTEDQVRDDNHQACFTQKDDTHEWQVTHFTIPEDTKYFVGNKGWWYYSDLGVGDSNGQKSKSVMKEWTWTGDQVMYLAHVGRGYTLGHAVGAVGTLRIYDNTSLDNLDVAFIPNGYGITLTRNNSEAKTAYAFHTTSVDHKWETDVLNLPGITNNKYTVGLATQVDNEYVASNHSKAPENLEKMGVTEIVEGKRMIYLKPNDDWKTDNARFAAYFFGNGEKWVDMSDADGDGIYECEKPDGYTTVIFCRMKPDATANNWNNRWNQTQDITLSTDGLAKVCTITGWDSSSTIDNASPKTNQNGKFRMWDNSTNKNWFVHFIPYYLLTYNANGGEGEMPAEEYNTEDANNKVTIAANGFTRRGYDFVKWNTQADGAGTDYNSGDEYTMTSDATIYAQWKVQEYTINYKDQGNADYSGTNLDDLPTTHTYGIATTIPNGEKIGYTFEGWYLTPECDGTPITELVANDYIADITLYAKWTFAMEYDITNAEPVFITSAVGQTIKGTTPLTLAVSNMPVGTEITISAPNITFYDEAGVVVTELTTQNNPEEFNLTAAYTPTAEKTIEQPTITLDVLGYEKEISDKISCRSLPATFAIVAKVGNLWYALPSQGLNSTTPPAAYPVEVDDMADPTTVTAIPANADWSLRGVYEASRSDATKDRYVANGDNLVFVNNASPAMTLNASSSGNYLLTDAQYNNYYSTNPGLYEWTPTTTDLETYQLTNEQRSRTLSVNTATVFGVHAQDKAVEQVRFLPIQNRYTPAALQVVEWKENSVVIMYNGDPAQTASVSVNGAAAQNTTLSAAQRDIAVYELAANGLAANPTQRLSITIGTEKVILSIPYIISGDQTDLALLPGSTVAARQEVAKVSDMVILKGATLTADGAKGNPYNFRNVTIYGGGKLVIPSEAKGFGVASLTLRAGGITDAGEYDYVYPQFELRGTFTNSAAKINYDYITDYYHWYHLVLPFAGDLTIKYPTEFYGANVAADNTGSWQIKRYAGEIRATGNYDAWVDIETEGETSTIAGQGYIFWGAPKKVSVNGGDTERQKWGIQRITMSVTASDAETEKEDKTIAGLGSYENVPNNSHADNDQGWNLVGNPYMVNLTDMATTGLHACKLVEVIDPATGKWNGKWEWNDETNIRYLTIPSEHFDTYTAKTVNQAVPLVAGRAFFVQLEGEANAITFAAANRASLMPALRAANDKPVDIETGIILSNETLQDEVNFWIKDGKTNDYEYNADYPKTPNNNQFNIYGVHTNGDLSWVATGPEYAAESMPIGYQVPAAGTYMLSLSEIYNSDGLDALYVTDHALSPEVTVDIMSEPYEFSVNQAETNNERFTVSVRVKAKTENGATGLGNVGADGEQIHKFIYQDKMYILHHGVIYDATGKRVITINK